MVSEYNFYIINQFQTNFAKEGEEKNRLVDVTVNSKEENLCPNYVQEFGLCTRTILSLPPRNKRYNTVDVHKTF